VVRRRVGDGVGGLLRRLLLGHLRQCDSGHPGAPWRPPRRPRIPCAGRPAPATAPQRSSGGVSVRSGAGPQSGPRLLFPAKIQETFMAGRRGSCIDRLHACCQTKSVHHACNYARDWSRQHRLGRPHDRTLHLNDSTMIRVTAVMPRPYPPAVAPR
jgi:hypothetical protein